MVLASMVFLTAVLVTPPTDASDPADVAREPLVAHGPTGSTDTNALARLDDRVAAVEVATVALVGHPLVDTTEVASRTQFRPDPVDDTAAPAMSGLTAEQLPDRVLVARRLVASGDVDAAARIVKGVETDVLLVALDLGEQSAQNVAITRLLVSADPQVAVLDAAVGATHAAAQLRDVVAAATSAVQARDAAAGITVAAQQISVTGDQDALAAAATAEAARVAGLARSTDGYTNGSVPLKVLCRVSFAPSNHLRCDAAEALTRLNAAYQAAFGRDLAISGSYRTLEEQISTRAAKGSMAAVPGTSNHGWGLAIDLDGRHQLPVRAVRLAQGQRDDLRLAPPGLHGRGRSRTPRAVALGVRHVGRRPHQHVGADHRGRRDAVRHPAPDLARTARRRAAQRRSGRADADAERHSHGDGDADVDADAEREPERLHGADRSLTWREVPSAVTPAAARQTAQRRRLEPEWSGSRRRCQASMMCEYIARSAASVVPASIVAKMASCSRRVCSWKDGGVVPW